MQYRPSCFHYTFAQPLGVEPKAFCSTFAVKLLAKAGGIALTATGATRKPMFSCVFFYQAISCPFTFNLSHLPRLSLV
jgi:hypothetical protein